MPVSLRHNRVMFSTAPLAAIRSESPSGWPSFVQAYVIVVGLAFATIVTCNGSLSTPTTVDEGTGTNLGGSAAKP